MKKSKIYTKTGDKGETGLVSGNRTLKSDQRIDLYGELDELNSRIGYATSLIEVQNHKEKIDFLHLIQSAIFDLGSNLACEVENRARFNLPQLSDSFIRELESQIDILDKDLEPLKNFILPGGSVKSAALHLCRTNTRTVERKLIHYREVSKEELPQNSVIFLNRLSDYFFVMARWMNKFEKISEITWKSRSN